MDAMGSREKPWRGVWGGPGPESWLPCGDWDGWEQGGGGQGGEDLLPRVSKGGSDRAGGAGGGVEK